MGFPLAWQQRQREREQGGATPPPAVSADPLKCEICGGGPFKNAAGLAGHKRVKHSTGE